MFELLIRNKFKIISQYLECLGIGQCPPPPDREPGSHYTTLLPDSPRFSPILPNSPQFSTILQCPVDCFRIGLQSLTGSLDLILFSIVAQVKLARLLTGRLALITPPCSQIPSIPSPSPSSSSSSSRYFPSTFSFLSIWHFPSHQNFLSLSFLAFFFLLLMIQLPKLPLLSFCLSFLICSLPCSNEGCRC